MRRRIWLAAAVLAVLTAGAAAGELPFPVEERQIDEMTDEPSAEVHATYPQLAGAPESVNTTIAEVVRTILGDFRHNLDPDAYGVRASTATVAWRITYASPELVGVRLEAALTFGDVRRPTADIRNLLFDLKTGQRLAPVDLFDRLAHAQEVVVRHCLAALEEAAGRRNLKLADIADEGWVQMVLAGPAAWGLTEEGFVLSFNLGHELGVEEVMLPFAVIRSYLKPAVAAMLHMPA